MQGSRLRAGKHKELRVISELLGLGLDVYTATVDDQGIDCILRWPGPSGPVYYDVQIKGYRGYNRVVGVQRGTLETKGSNYLLLLGFFHDDGKDEIYFLTKDQVLKIKDEAFATLPNRDGDWGDVPFNKRERDRFASQRTEHLPSFLAQAL